MIGWIGLVEQLDGNMSVLHFFWPKVRVNMEVVIHNDIVRSRER